MISTVTDRLNWLEYSLKRSLWLDGAENEQKLGTEQAILALNSIENVLNKLKEIVYWLNEAF